MESDLLKTLTSFVPALVVRKIAADPRPISEPTAERFSAAVLFADITEFTALAHDDGSISIYFWESSIDGELYNGSDISFKTKELYSIIVLMNLMRLSNMQIQLAIHFFLQNLN